MITLCTNNVTLILWMRKSVLEEMLQITKDIEIESYDWGLKPKFNDSKV